MKICGYFDVAHRVCVQMAFGLMFVCLVASSASAQMVHPGGWHTQDDLTTIREKIAAQEEASHGIQLDFELLAK